jgi:hypothetical protein
MASLDASAQGRAQRLVERFKQLDAPDAEKWARSEMIEDIPQLARFLLLRRLWREEIDVYRDSSEWISSRIRAAEREPNGPFADAGFAMKRLLNAGVPEEEIKSIARDVACSAIFATLSTLDEMGDPDIEAPGWMLVETNRHGEATGRSLDDLHASLLSADPSGREGRPR